MFIITDESLNFWMERVTNEIALFSKRCILDHSAWNYKRRFMSTFPYKWLNVDLYSMKYSMVGTSISFLNVQSGLAKTKTQRKTIRWFWTVQYNTIDIRLYSRVYNSEKVENLPFKWFIWGKKNFAWKFCPNSAFPRTSVYTTTVQETTAIGKTHPILR